MSDGELELAVGRYYFTRDSSRVRRITCIREDKDIQQAIDEFGNTYYLSGRRLAPGAPCSDLMRPVCEAGQSWDHKYNTFKLHSFSHGAWHNEPGDKRIFRFTERWLLENCRQVTQLPDETVTKLFVLKNILGGVT